jgi:hypothetical protein
MNDFSPSLRRLRVSRTAFHTAALGFAQARQGVGQQWSPGLDVVRDRFDTRGAWVRKAVFDGLNRTACQQSGGFDRYLDSF